MYGGVTVSMRYLTVQQMREADRRCIEELGIPGVVLMNNAGRAVFKELEPGPITVVCGKGNNGGDGFVVARFVLVAGWDVKVILLSEPSNIRGDAEIFMKTYLRLGGKIITCLDEKDIYQEMDRIAEHETCVDAILGTGTKGEVTGILRVAIESMGRLKNIVSVDLPSGMNADSGDICGVCVRARKTVTFQYPKIGFSNPLAKQYLGEVVVVDIGIPSVCIDDNEWFALKEANKVHFS